jgi:hypothetical protein
VGRRYSKLRLIVSAYLSGKEKCILGSNETVMKSLKIALVKPLTHDQDTQTEFSE